LGQRNVESMKLAEANSRETTVKLIKLFSSVRMRDNLTLRLELETTLAMTKPWSQRTNT